MGCCLGKYSLEATRTGRRAEARPAKSIVSRMSTMDVLSLASGESDFSLQSLRSGRYSYVVTERKPDTNTDGYVPLPFETLSLKKASEESAPEPSALTFSDNVKSQSEASQTAPETEVPTPAKRVKSKSESFKLLSLNTSSVIEKSDIELLDCPKENGSKSDETSKKSDSSYSSSPSIGERTLKLHQKGFKMAKIDVESLPPPEVTKSDKRPVCDAGAKIGKGSLCPCIGPCKLVDDELVEVKHRKSSQRGRPEKKRMVIALHQSYFHTLSPKDMVYIAGNPTPRYLKSFKDLRPSSCQFRSVYKTEREIEELRKQGMIMTYAEILAKRRLTDDQILLEQIQNIYAMNQFNKDVLKRFGESIRELIQECSQDSNEVDTGKDDQRKSQRIERPTIKDDKPG